MKSIFVFSLSLAMLAGAWTTGTAQTPEPAPAPATPPPAAAPTPAPAPAKPHVVDVPQPDESYIPPSPPPTGAPPDPAKVAEYQQRFQQGQELEREGKLVEARAIYDGIILDSPEAKGSLMRAGFISVRLNEMTKAGDYFEKLHAQVPDFPPAIEALIQINQTLQKDQQVAHLIKEFKVLRSQGKVPQPYFVRERIHLSQGEEIVLSEFFDYRSKPYAVWMAEAFDSSGVLQHRLFLNYDPGATQELRAKDPKLATAEQFFLVESILQDGKPVRLDAYFQMFSLPEYKKIRATMLGIISGMYKPLYSRTIGSATPAPAQ